MDSHEERMVRPVSDPVNRAAPTVLDDAGLIAYDPDGCLVEFCDGAKDRGIREFFREYLPEATVRKPRLNPLDYQSGNFPGGLPFEP